MSCKNTRELQWILSKHNKSQMQRTAIPIAAIIANSNSNIHGSRSSATKLVVNGNRDSSCDFISNIIDTAPIEIITTAIHPLAVMAASVSTWSPVAQYQHHIYQAFTIASQHSATNPKPATSLALTVAAVAAVVKLTSALIATRPFDQRPKYEVQPLGATSTASSKATSTASSTATSSALLTGT